MNVLNTVLLALKDFRKL